MLVGRELETARLAALVEQAMQGQAASLVLRGEPGAGKTALLEALADRVDRGYVLRTQGLEAESPLAFAALHRLLRPVMSLRDGLPAPQARALRVAFGEEEGPPVQPFLVALATLSILATAAEQNQLVLCLVDDAHWLDVASADALLFVARRLAADRVVVVFSVRDGSGNGFAPADLPELVLPGLGPDAARTLLDHALDRALGDALTDEVTERLIGLTGGNPLALLELPTALSAAQRRGSAPLPAQLKLTARVERAFLDRAERLPADVRRWLLLAAADDSGRVAVVSRAAEGLGLDADARDEAVGSGLLTLAGDVLRVRHPLVRSAVYQAATSDQRRQVHHALAAALRAADDPDREAWHRAAAASGPDEGVVAALEVVGARAERRGGYGAALAAYERAAELTVKEPLRAGRLFAAARNAWACGRAAHARALLVTARERATDPLLRSDLARLQARIEVNVGSASEAHRIFVDAAQAVQAIDPLRALEMASAAALISAFGAGSGVTSESLGALKEPSDADTPRTLCLKQLLLSMTLAADDDWSGAVAALEPALRGGEGLADLDLLGNLGNAALQVGDDESQRHCYSLMLAGARDSGAVMAVIYALQRLSFGYLAAGDWAALRASAEEALTLARSVGQPALTAGPLAWLTLLAALQARSDYAGLLSELEDVVAAHPLGILTDPVHDLTRWAAGARAAAEGDLAGALRQLGLIRMPVLRRMAAVEGIEVAVRAGDPRLAGQWWQEMAPFAEGTGWAWALALVAFGRAMTADTSEADELFQLALTAHTQARRPYDAARTHLAYGEWLRRHQRRVDARSHLRQALETFHDLHADALAERAAQELRASGETARKRDPSTLVALTPMELKVAQLVSSGLSNKDVAAQCWVSPRTVAFHLRNVFAKAGVTSRGELARLELV